VTQLDFLFHPATFYSVALICLATSLGLFVSLKIEMARTRTLGAVPEVASEGIEDVDSEAIRKLKAEVEQLREAVTRLEQARPAPVAPADGVNLTKREVALRMHRRGEPVTSIAAALETPGNEIALMLKVHELTNGEVN
jgi:hypothetical protein